MQNAIARDLEANDQEHSANPKKRTIANATEVVLSNLPPAWTMAKLTATTNAYGQLMRVGYLHDKRRGVVIFSDPSAASHLIDVFNMRVVDRYGVKATRRHELSRQK
jgi:hypothetical protein